MCRGERAAGVIGKARSLSTIIFHTCLLSWYFLQLGLRAASLATVARSVTGSASGSIKRLVDELPEGPPASRNLPFATAPRPRFGGGMVSERLGACAGAGAGAPAFARLRGVSMTTADCAAFAAAPSTLRRLFGDWLAAGKAVPSGAGAGAHAHAPASPSEPFAAATPICILGRLPPACILGRLPAACDWQDVSAAGAGAPSSVGGARGLSTSGGGSPGGSPFVSGSPPMAGVPSGLSQAAQAQLVLRVVSRAGWLPACFCFAVFESPNLPNLRRNMQTETDIHPNGQGHVARLRLFADEFSSFTGRLHGAVF